MKVERVTAIAEDKRHQQDIESIVVSANKLYSGDDEGIIKVWSTEDLGLLHEFKAHDYAVNHLLVSKDRLYSASMDQTIKSWQLDTWRLVSTFVGHEETPRRLATDGQSIFCGDDKGEVIKWTKDGLVTARYGIVEEVWDLHVQSPYIYTVRDRGLTISEPVHDSSNTTCLRSLEGRAPFYIDAESIFMLDRSGTVVNHFENKPSTFNFIKELKGHESIVTAITGWDSYLLSSGYDAKLFIWSMKEGTLLETFPLNGCPNSVCVSETGEVFVGDQNGSILKLKLIP